METAHQYSDAEAALSQVSQVTTVLVHLPALGSFTPIVLLIFLDWQLVELVVCAKYSNLDRTSISRPRINRFVNMLSLKR